uniref:Ig-like domain-containing protein n=1 Tax=Oryzias latipes TaxID=8090 RepID=A0A3P9I3I8_ORYLA
MFYQKKKRTAGRIQTAPEGSKVHLECSVITSDPQVRVEWILPDLSTLEDSNDKIEFSEGGKLVILNASMSDSGVYHCIIRTKSGVDLMPLRLTIKERSLSPTALNGQKITIKRGGFFSLPCEVTSVLPSQTIWYLPKNQVLLPTQRTRRLEVTENGTLVGRKLMQEDAGEYSCVASNLYGVDMLSHVVEVTEVKRGVKPRINTVTTSMSVLAETDVFLPCKATGNPEPNIVWTKVSTGKVQRSEQVSTEKSVWKLVIHILP